MTLKGLCVKNLLCIFNLIAWNPGSSTAEVMGLLEVRPNEKSSDH